MERTHCSFEIVHVKQLQTAAAHDSNKEMSSDTKKINGTCQWSYDRKNIASLNVVYNEHCIAQRDHRTVTR